MMKKFLYIIGFLMFSSGLFSPMLTGTVLGAGSDSSGSSDSSASCTFPWTSCLHPNIPDPNWGDRFGTTDPEKVGVDLYEDILQKVKVDPDKKAFKNTAGAFGTSEGNMNRLLNNDLGPILDKSPYLTQDEAIKKMMNIQQRYQEEKDIFALKEDLDAATTPSEIFANDDTSDSGFDLINDLSNIENILFKKMDPIDVGGAYNASASGGAGGAGTPGNKTGAKTPPPSEGTGSASSPLTGGGTSPGTGTQQTTPAADQSGLGKKPSATSNPNICFADQKLDQALKDFQSKKLSDPNYKETPTKPVSSGGTGTSGSGGGGGGGENTGSTSSALSAPAEFDYNPPPLPPAQSAPASNWLNDLPCNDILCLKINFVKTTAAAYVDSDNCIACHIEKINEKLKETINHSLIPGKATGNLLEPGLCKQAAAGLFSKAGIRFYAVAKPIKTPTNDDMIYGTSMVDEWDKFVNTYKPFPFYEKKIPDPSDPKQDASVPSVEDSAAKNAAAMATPDTSLDTISRNISSQVKGVQDQIARQVAIAEPSVQSDTDASFFQGIKKELEQMNFYFDSFQSILHRILEKVGDLNEDHPCQTLPDIKQCE